MFLKQLFLFSIPIESKKIFVLFVFSFGKVFSISKKNVNGRVPYGKSYRDIFLKMLQNL